MSERAQVSLKFNLEANDKEELDAKAYAVQMLHEFLQISVGDQVEISFDRPVGIPNEPHPDATVEERHWLLASCDAAYLEDVATRDIMEHLINHKGYPTSFDELEEMEREYFCGDGRTDMNEEPVYIVYTAEDALSFEDQDEAYAAFCEHYDNIYKMHGLKKE